MQKIVLMPDSFKGSLSAAEFCAIAARTIVRHFPACEVVSIPVADGGEGSVDCFLAALGGQKISLPVQGPLGPPVESYYGVLPTGEAVIEMAAAAGLPLLAGRLDVLNSNTFGVGQLILDALRRGCRKLILGLGGSCTNDGACGLAAALGVRFLDAAGEAFVPSGGSLQKIAAIDVSALDPRIRETEIALMCDIDNPLYGPEGAAYVFAPQKGADPAAQQLLDEGLRHLAGLIERDLGLRVADLPGSGAAGGMGAGLVAFCSGVLKPGIEVMLDTVDFARVAADADWIITGEGRLDSQSLGGKVVVGVSRRAKQLNKPVLALVGALQEGYQGAFAQGLTAAFSILPGAMPLEEAFATAGQNLADTVDNLCRLWLA